MVAPEPAVSELPAARARRRGIRALRPHLPELAPDAARGGIRVHVLRRHDAHAADSVREPRPLRVARVARRHLVHADREGPADSVHRSAAPVEIRFRRERAPADRRLFGRRLPDLRGHLTLVRLFFFALIGGSLFHGTHRLKFMLVDAGLRRPGIEAALDIILNAIAIAGTLGALYYAVRGWLFV